MKTNCVIQLIGLPGAGKTHALQKIIERNKHRVRFLDIRDYPNSKSFTHAIKQIASKGIVIAESACGITMPSIVIRLDTPIQTVYGNINKRGETPDPDYLSLIECRMLPATYTIRTEEELLSLLKQIIVRHC
jgi:hypothetical protein